ncbi:hypothetical protein ABH906_005659 [Pseudomonas frederiksbergensis]
MVRAVKKGAILRGLRGVAIGAGAQRLRETLGHLCKSATGTDEPCGEGVMLPLGCAAVVKPANAVYL